MEQAMSGYEPPQTAQLAVNGYPKGVTTRITVNSRTPLRGEEVDQFLNGYADVINPQYKPWHAKFVYDFGYTHYDKQVALARTKHVPKAYLIYLLKLNWREKAKKDQNNDLTTAR